MNSLDDLYAAARAAITKGAKQAVLDRKNNKPMAALAAEPPSPDLYTNPDNWTYTRSIALIHAETQTLLGTFDVFNHTRDASARRYLPAAVPRLLLTQESVSGDWWVAERHQIANAYETWEHTRSVCLDVVLDKMGVWSPATLLSVHTSHGATTKITLEDDTQFAQLAGAPDQLLLLSKGTNILPLLSQETKIAVKIEVEKETT